MNARVAARVGWSAFLFTLGCTVSVWVAIRHPELSGALGVRPIDSLWYTWYLGFPAVGAVIVSRRPGNRVGWILCAIGGSLGLAVASDLVGRAAILGTTDPSLAARLPAWLSTVVVVPGVVLVLFLLLVFPHGRLPSPRWRLPARLAAAAAAVMSVWQALAPGPLLGMQGADNPFGIQALGALHAPLSNVLVVGLALFGLAVLASSVVRLVRARGEERAQGKWLTYALAMFPALMAGGAVTDSQALEVLAFALTGNGIAVAIGVAVLRYRLYEIDRIISRTVTYALLTGILVAVYLGVIFALQQLLRPVTGESQLAIAGATLAVAALFGPARRRVQTAVDRRFNRARYDTQRTLDTFRARLRDEVDLHQLEAELVGAVRSTVEPAHVKLWLRSKEGSP